MTPESKPVVRATRCDHQASDENVYLALRRATEPLAAAWDKLERAHRVTIKFNQAMPPDRVRYENGTLLDLVDPRVARATLRLLRERTKAEIVCCELSVYRGTPFDEANVLLPILREFDVPLIDGNQAPARTYPVPGGGQMFSRYLLPDCVGEADAFVSVQMLKSHKFMGLTLSLKNLFGLTPQEPLGRMRQYFHHICRLPHVLVDLGRLINPTLSIVDGLYGQTKNEWGGPAFPCDLLMAGDQTIATDACGAHLMGYDPLGDWPDHPFLRARNALRVAHEAGFGTADLNEIDFDCEVDAPVGAFSTLVTDPPELVRAWRQSTCEQALYYRDHMAELIDQYAGEYIMLQDGIVRWHGTTGVGWGSRRDIAGPNKASALFLKLVDPAESEGEHFTVYERELARLNTNS